MNLIPPFLIMTDSYKGGHPIMYPDVEEMTAYIEARGPFGEVADDRIVFYGTRYIYETILSRKITHKDIEEADLWYSTHGVAKSQFYYPRDLWIAVIEENGGYLPLKVEALPEGTVMYPHIPCVQVTAKKKFARLVTWFETLLLHLWSPTVTATKSRMVWDYLSRKFQTTVDPEMHFLLPSRFHDFGFRGVSSVETAMTTGVAHLLSFEGTDTQVAGWLATQFNEGRPVGESVLATEHSVMTSWDSELEAILNLIEKAPEGAILSVVADSYDFMSFLKDILPQVAPLSKAKNQLFVIRPDSGDPISQVQHALRYAELAFGSTKNKLGFKILDGAAVIQGDGLNYGVLCRVADAVENMGFSAQCVAYGMGGGLLQKQDRDTLRFAMKLNHIVKLDGASVDKMKHPKTDITKFSLPGVLEVRQEKFGLTVVPSGAGWNNHRLETNLLQTIWNNGPTDHKFESFDDIRKRLNYEWSIRPKFFEVISPELREKINKLIT